MPTVLLLDVDGKSGIKGANKVMKGNEVVAETLELGKLERVRKAAEAYPFNAIHILNVETGEIPPRFLLLVGFLFARFPSADMAFAVSPTNLNAWSCRNVASRFRLAVAFHLIAP